jgi:hypothetical protein
MFRIPEFIPGTSPNDVPYFRQSLVFLLVFALMAPTAFVLYQLFHGNLKVGLVGCVLWLPVVSYLSLSLHVNGVIRLAILAPMLIVSSAVFAVAFAN